jgi:heme/copper-type cytochrome/quinol oxidase subunit 4
MIRGKDTTEYKVEQQSKTFAYVGLILAGILSLSDFATGMEGRTGTWVAMIIAVAAALQKGLVSLGYIAARKSEKDNHANRETGGPV